jgi:ABC-type phosphate transport system substrate-binding protein
VFVRKVQRLLEGKPNMPMKFSLKAGVAMAGAFALAASVAAPALADDAPRPTDVIGVGSDTVQYGADFLADGDANGHAGFNSTAKTNRMISFFATGDANGRATYNKDASALPGTAVLRSGTKPVPRPNGSGAGISALIADSGTGYTVTGYPTLPAGSINYVRASRLPKGAEQSSCAALASTCGGLHVFQFATDNLQIAKATTSNMPAAGLSIDELLSIYNCSITKWNLLPGNSAGSANTIHPVIPQSGSGTHDFFLADLQAANGGVAVTPGACVTTVQEHDPNAILGNPDAIGPFSAGRVTLLNSGYFGSAVQNQVVLQGAGTAGDGTAVYTATRGLYFIVRDVDLTSPTIFQPGGTKNFAQTLFQGTSSWIARGTNAPLIASAGLTQAYSDLGDASAG